MFIFFRFSCLFFYYYYYHVYAVSLINIMDDGSSRKKVYTEKLGKVKLKL